MLDQIQAMDKARLVRRLGHLSKPYQDAVLAVLNEVFAEQLAQVIEGLNEIIA